MTATRQFVKTAMPLLRHTALEDLLALLSGTLLVSLGVVMLGKAKLVTGGVAGIAFIAHYASGIGFGPLFFAINLPFYFLAWRKMGPRFVLKTFAAVAMLATFSELLPKVLTIAAVNTPFAAVAGGLLTGVGLLILFRHRASLGGLNILVLYLQERFGLRAGYVQLGIDAIILLAALPFIGLGQVGMSLIGAAVLNLTLAINHRPGRYMAI